MISYHYARFVMLNIPLLRWIERRKMVAIFWSNVRLNTQCFTAMNHSFTDVKITSNRWKKKNRKKEPDNNTSLSYSEMSQDAHLRGM